MVIERKQHFSHVAQFAHVAFCLTQLQHKVNASESFKDLKPWHTNNTIMQELLTTQNKDEDTSIVSRGQLLFNEHRSMLNPFAIYQLTSPFQDLITYVAIRLDVLRKTGMYFGQGWQQYVC